MLVPSFLVNVNTVACALAASKRRICLGTALPRGIAQEEENGQETKERIEGVLKDIRSAPCLGELRKGELHISQGVTLGRLSAIR